MQYMTFDIETIPDVDSGRKLLQLDQLGDADVAEAMMAKRREKTGSDFLPLHLQRVVAISVALRQGDQFRVWSLGDEDADEAEMIRRFFDGIERFSPDLVSWNGGGFDLPVLHYRALLHGVSAPMYWENGDNHRDFRYNSYLSRYHWRHIDLMDVLAGFNNRGRAPLDDIAVMLGLPGKLGMSGDKVYAAWQQGEIRRIRQYCETDVLNTWLVFAHFEHLRGRLDDQQLRQERELALTFVESTEGEHWQAYANAWQLQESADGS
ncbi:MAG: 3'-5' exonuclease [Pseudomonadota bacterium]